MNSGIITASAPDFSIDVARNGYAWWYVDALSDDGQHGLTIIAFIGSVFSPYYLAARARGAGDPLNHCAINVALYGRTKRWAMTERGRCAVSRSKQTFRAGPSALDWDGATLTIGIDEICMPIPHKLRGRVRVRPTGLTGEHFVLAKPGHHCWQPLAPLCRVEADFQNPALSWSGRGYFDRNWGAEPLEDGFRSWTWSRSEQPGATTIFYDVARRVEPDEAPGAGLALRVGANGQITPMTAPPKAALPKTQLWRIPRETRSDAGSSASVLQTLEDTPFYARSIVANSIDGQPAKSFHEALSLDRFKSRIVQRMLPFRMPRRAGKI